MAPLRYWRWREFAHRLAQKLREMVGDMAQDSVLLRIYMTVVMVGPEPVIRAVVTPLVREIGPHNSRLRVGNFIRLAAAWGLTMTELVCATEDNVITVYMVTDDGVAVHVDLNAVEADIDLLLPLPRRYEVEWAARIDASAQLQTNIDKLVQETVRKTNSEHLAIREQRDIRLGGGDNAGS